MQVQAPEQFQHTTLTAYPDKIVGVTLLDETPGFTGIYLRDPNGGLWPARTVNREDAQHHFDVCESWLSRPGALDKRGP
jgi:hypothetical protein